METGSRDWFPGGRGGSQKFTVNRHEGSYMGDGNTLKQDSGDGGQLGKYMRNH